MLGRALSLATVTLLIGCFAAAPARAQAQNLEAGKSPSQIFAGTCTACHKSPRGLLRTVPAGSLPGFLREHYTTSSGMASLLSTYLISNGATDTRYGGGQPRPGKGAKSEARSGGEPEQADRHGRRSNPPREAAEPPQGGKPDADRFPRRPSRDSGAATPGGWSGQGRVPTPRNRRKFRLRPSKPISTAAMDARPDTGRASAAGRPSTRSPAWVRRRRRQANQRPAKSDNAKSDNAKSDDAKPQAGKTDAAKTDAAKDQSAKTEPAKEEKPRIRWQSGQARRSQSFQRGQFRGGQGRTAEGNRQQRCPGAAHRSGSPGDPCAAAGSPAASTVAPGGTSAAASSARQRLERTSAPAAPPARLRQRRQSAAPAAPRPEGSPVPPISK